MNYPVVIIVGKAGAGKDTLAALLCEAGGQVISHADPLKRFARSVLGFTEDQLWGPSEARNAPDPRSAAEIERAWDTHRDEAWAWLEDIGIPPGDDCELDVFMNTHVLGVEGISARTVLQKLGTEFGRAISPSLWTDYAQRVARDLLTSGGTYDRLRGIVPGTTRSKFVVIPDARFPNEVLATKVLGGLAIQVQSPETRALEGAAGQHVSETQQDLIPESWYDVVVVNNKSHGLEALKCAANRVVTQEILRRPVCYGTRSLGSPERAVVYGGLL